MLSYIVNQYRLTNYDFLLKLDDAQTASSYALNQKFIDKLLTVYLHNISAIEKSGFIKHEQWNDQCWRSLQPGSKWFGINPILGYQQKNYICR